MGTIVTITKREVAGLFFSPIGYMVLFLFLVFLGILFGGYVFKPGELADPRMMFNFSRYGLFLIVPLMTMSMFSDEYRSGRIEMLRTSPLTEFQLLIGKFAGAMTFYTVLLGATLLYVLLLVIFGRPDYGAVIASYLGMFLLGAMFVSIGLFFSSCTQEQIVAALSAIIVLGAFTWIDYFAPGFPEKFSFLGIPIYLRRICMYIGAGSHLQDFLKGVVDTAHVAYFIFVSTFFLFLTYLVLESRKWR